MGKTQFDPPTDTFPYKIKKRLNIMSVPRKQYIDKGEGMPAYTPRGIRQSAVRAHCSDRVNDAGWPYVRRFLLIKKMYKNQFSLDRMERIDRMMEVTNATCYSKLANCVLDLRKDDTKDTRKKKGWSESEWKKHMEYISQIAGPRRDFKAPPMKRDKGMPLEMLLQRINQICFLPEFRVYKRYSQDILHKDPIKVSPRALRYEITDRVNNLALPKVQPDPNNY